MDGKRISHVVIDLTRQSLINSKQFTIRASGWSMFPTILPGLLITIQRGAFQDIKRGDIILFEIQQPMIIVHRVLRISESPQQPRLLFTKGDAQKDFDPLVSESNYIAVVRTCGKSRWSQFLWGMINSVVGYIQIELDAIRIKYQPLKNPLT